MIDWVLQLHIYAHNANLHEFNWLFVKAGVCRGTRSSRGYAKCNFCFNKKTVKQLGESLYL